MKDRVLTCFNFSLGLSFKHLVECLFISWVFSILCWDPFDPTTSNSVFQPPEKNTVSETSALGVPWVFFRSRKASKSWRIHLSSVRWVRTCLFSCLNSPDISYVWGKRLNNIITGWWFQIFFIFTPTWWRFPYWLIFFKWLVQPPTR